MKQQTAVEWLAEKLLEHAYKNEFDPYHGSDKIIARAKKKEEKQLKNCWWDGFRWDSEYKNFEDYYQNTYREDK